MERNLLNDAERYAKRNQRRRIWQKIVGGLGCVVVFCTTYALILPAITQERETYCGMEAHTHEEACYTKSGEVRAQVCAPEAPYAHTHSDLCYWNEELVCQLSEVSQHVHTEACYAPAETVLHQHSADCYEQQQGDLVCTLEEGESHTHGTECYSWTEVLTCGLEEGQAEPAAQTEPVLTCTEPVLTEHVHSDSCFETILVDVPTCGLEEHEHELICYSNPESEDIETAEDWEASFEDVELTDDCNQNILLIAESQLGYKESVENYAVDEDGTTVHGFTRYGAWAGTPYADWNALFVSFCLHYADVIALPDLDADCQTWIAALSDEEYGLYHAAAEYTPKPGELIFFQDAAKVAEAAEAEETADAVPVADRVGLVVELIAATDTEPAKIKTIEGDSNLSVEYVTYELDDPTILGYAEMPIQLTEEEWAQVDELVALIDKLPPYEELGELYTAMYETEEPDDQTLADYNEAVVMIGKAVHIYSLMSDLQKSYVTNVDTLMAVSSFVPATLAGDNEIPIYQINSYYPSGGSDPSFYGPIMIWDEEEDDDSNWGSYADDGTETRSETLGGGGSFDEEVQETWMYDMTFNYWDAVAVAPVTGTDYYQVTKYDVSTGDKSNIEAPEGGFVLIFTNTSAHNFWLSSLSIHVGSYVTISPDDFDFTQYPGSFTRATNGDLVFDETKGYYNGSPYCTITFSDTAPEEPEEPVEGLYEIPTASAVSTKDYIELNLYDYYGAASAAAAGKSDINSMWDITANTKDSNGNTVINKDSVKKEYPGFQWNGGAYPYKYYYTTSSSYTGDNYVADRNVVDNIDFGNSMITDYKYSAPTNYGDKAASAQMSAYGNSEGWGRINRIEVNAGYGVNCRPIGMSTLYSGGTVLKTFNEVLTRTLYKKNETDKVGYPQLAALQNNASTNYGSLEYLFTDSNYAKKINGSSIDGLFQYNEVTGEYSYNSRENHAYYNASTNSFTLYNAIATPNFILYPFGNFLPFNDITDKAKTINVGEYNYSPVWAPGSGNGDYDYTTWKPLKMGGGSKYIQRIIDRLDTSDPTEKQLQYMLNSYKKNWSMWSEKNETFNGSWKGTGNGYNGKFWMELSTSDMIDDFFNLTANSEPSTANVDSASWTFEDGRNLLDNMYNIDFDQEKNFFFGMEMKMNFYQPKDGMTGQDTNRDGEFDYPMYFYFTGDDDVWVYIDDVLFLDLSGIHRHVGGKIDFVNGRVYYFYLDVDSAGDVVDINGDNLGTSYIPYQADGTKERYYTFEELLTAAGKNPADFLKKSGGKYTTFKDYTIHDFHFYYMERGSGSSVCRLNFNFPLVQYNTLSVQKEMTETETPILGNPDYTFQVLAAIANTDEDGNVTGYTKTNESYFKKQDETGEHWAYSLYDTDGQAIQEVHVVDKNPDGTVKTLETWQGNQLLSKEEQVYNEEKGKEEVILTYYTGARDEKNNWILTNTDDSDPENDGKTPDPKLLTIASDGSFTLKAGQRAEFVGIIESWGPYYVQEVVPESLLEKYNDSDTGTTITTKVYHGDVYDEAKSEASTVKGTSSNVFDANTSTYFTFTNPVFAGNLAVSKTVESNNAQANDKQFEFEVTLDDKPLPQDVTYTVKYTKDGKEVEETRSVTNIYLDAAKVESRMSPLRYVYAENNLSEVGMAGTRNGVDVQYTWYLNQTEAKTEVTCWYTDKNGTLYENPESTEGLTLTREIHKIYLTGNGVNVDFAATLGLTLKHTYIILRHGETATISNILSDSKFKVTETAGSSQDSKVTYFVDGKEQDTSYAEGTIKIKITETEDEETGETIKTVEPETVQVRINNAQGSLSISKTVDTEYSKNTSKLFTFDVELGYTLPENLTYEVTYRIPESVVGADQTVLQSISYVYKNANGTEVVNPESVTGLTLDRIEITATDAAETNAVYMVHLTDGTENQTVFYKYTKDDVNYTSTTVPKDSTIKYTVEYNVYLDKSVYLNADGADVQKLSYVYQDASGAEVIDPESTTGLTLLRIDVTGTRQPVYVYVDGEGKEYTEAAEGRTLKCIRIQLKRGETADIQSIPSGTTFKVTETNASAEDYTVVYMVNGVKQITSSASGNVESGKAAQVTVTNSEICAKLPIYVEKRMPIYGNAREFEFNLQRVTSATDMTAIGDPESTKVSVSNKSTQAERTVSFEMIYLPEDMDGADANNEKYFYYTITETPNPSIATMDYDKTVYLVEVKVTKSLSDAGKTDITPVVNRVWTLNDGALVDNEKTKDVDESKEVTDSEKKLFLPATGETMPENPTLTFTNTILRKLVIKKTVSGGTESDLETPFNFTIKLEDGSSKTDVKGYTYKGTLKDQDGKEKTAEYTLNEKNEISISLKHGETFTLFVPYQSKWTVTEESEEGYLISYTTTTTTTTSPTQSETATGTASATTTTVTFTNARLYTLPESGGAGTTTYTMAGLMLMLFSAAYLLYRHQKRRREAM